MLDTEIIRSNTTVNDNVLRASGIATPNCTVEFWIDGYLGSSVTADNTGAWNVTYLTFGATSVVFKELSEYGAIISETQPIYFADLASGGNTPTPIVQLDTITVKNNMSISNNLLLSTGIATQGYNIGFWIDGLQTYTASTNGDGSWAIQFPIDGAKEIVVKEIDINGMVCSETAPISITEVAGYVAPTPIVPLDTATVKANMSFTLSGNILSTGVATAGYTIAFIMNGIQAGSTQVGIDGNWSYQAPVILGATSVVVQELDINNSIISQTSSIPFTEITGYVAPTPDPEDNTGNGGNSGTVSTMVEEIQLITGETNIQLINLLIRKSQNFIKMYCKVDEITEDLLDLVQDLTIYKVNSLNRDNVTSEKVGGFSVAYNFTELPPLLQKQLKFVAQKGMISIW